MLITIPTPNYKRSTAFFASIAITIITFFIIRSHLVYPSQLSSSAYPVTPGIIYQQSSSGPIMVARFEDYIKEDYRAFIFALHQTHGMLLLYCSRKKKKSPHFQAPGGHVDREDFQDAISRTSESSHEGPALLMLGCKIGVARELYEETGLDIRSALDRIQPVRLRENSDESLFCEFKKRLFFKLCVEDSDFVGTGTQSMNPNPPSLKLKLSHEHQGFVFEPDATKSADLLVQHSGGKVSKALGKDIEQGEITSIEGRLDDVGVAEDLTTPSPAERGNESSEENGKKFGCFNCC
mmetsp:Transcript_2226/g.4795  ORF Transcript_2226/g.4795 Transcript_2226/m.4795 type:complete len:294 (+) Transcript_2226:36-917(+)